MWRWPMLHLEELIVCVEDKDPSIVLHMVRQRYKQGYGLDETAPSRLKTLNVYCNYLEDPSPIRTQLRASLLSTEVKLYVDCKDSEDP